MLKFMVFGDLHYDDLDDSDKRIEELLSKAKAEQVDFIVSLGDLCFPIDENRHVLEKLQSAGIPIYHAIGNHDTQVTPIETTLQFLGKEKSYGSFEYGEYKFIILDTCYWRNESGDHHFPNAKREPGIYPVVPTEQVEWLKQELSDNKKYIFFSHMSLVNEFAKRGIRNRQEILDLFAGKEVLLCMNGHDHGVDLKLVNDIPFYTVNSAALYCWWAVTRRGAMSGNCPTRMRSMWWWSWTKGKSESRAWTVTGWERYRRMWVCTTTGGMVCRWSRGPVPMYAKYSL